MRKEIRVWKEYYCSLQNSKAESCDVVNYDRSSHRRCSVRKGVPRHFAKFTGKHLCHSLFFNKITCMKLATLLKKRS